LKNFSKKKFEKFFKILKTRRGYFQK